MMLNDTPLASAEATTLSTASGRGGRLLFKRRTWRELSWLRLVGGGRLDDAGRLPRYGVIALLGAAAIWTPIGTYLAKAPLRYSSELSLILPGSGSSASVNLDQLGQASSAAPSPFSSSTVSPTETYKRLLSADRILAAAAARQGMSRQAFGKPRIELVDQTGLIQLELTGPSPEDAQARAGALLAAFFSALDALRHDEQAQRRGSEDRAIEEYRATVAATRAEVARLQSESGLASAAQYAGLVSETDALRARVADLSAQLDDRTEAEASLESRLGVTPELAAALLKLQADAQHAALAAAAAEAAAALAPLSRLGPGHPERRTAEAGFAAARARMLAHAEALTGLEAAQLATLDLTRADERAGLLRDLVAAETARAGLAAERASQRARLATMETRVEALRAPAARLEDGERNFRVAETVLASAMARSGSAKTDLYASYPLVQVLEDPSLPDAPSSPRRGLAIAAGGAATIFLLIGLTLGWVRKPLIGRLLAPRPVAAAAP